MKVRSLLTVLAIAAIASPSWALCPPGAKGSAGAKLTAAGCGANCTKACCGKGSSATLTSLTAVAGCGANCAKACCGKGGSATLTSLTAAKGGCVKSMSKAARAGIPTMSYRVGDQTTNCPYSAKGMADKSKTQIEYVVDGNLFKSKGEAKTAYTKVLSSHLSKMTSVQFVVGGKCTGCPMTAKSMATKAGSPVKYRVASFDFDSKDAADSAAKLAGGAAAKVSMSWAVGQKSYQCPMTAGKIAKADGKTMEYVIGQKRSSCNITASVDLALAKIDAAITALEQATAPTTAATAVTEKTAVKS